MQLDEDINLIIFKTNNICTLTWYNVYTSFVSCYWYTIQIWIL